MTPRLSSGPRGLPLLANVFQLGRNQPGFLLEVQLRYGRMATIPVGSTPIKELARLQLFLVLPTILQRYVPLVLSEQVIEPLALITLRSKYGTRVRLDPVAPSVRAPHIGKATGIGKGRTFGPEGQGRPHQASAKVG